MGGGTIRFGVEKGKLNWGAFFRDMVRGNSPAAGKTFENYSSRGVSVVVRNATGEKHVLGVTRSVKEAQERAGAIEQEFKTLSTAEWCERYDVPISFVSG